MKHTEQRKKLRALLAGSKCHSPACVYDPLSARVAEAVGFEIGQLSGGIMSKTSLAAPDVFVSSLAEYADQIRRIMRVSGLSLFADYEGYGNALNVMRTVQEFEHAGASGVAIEDTVVPRSFGQAEGEKKLVSIEEGIGKMRAAVAARGDPSLVIAARTQTLKIEGIESAVARVKAYAAAGVDAIWMVSLENLEQIQTIHAAVNLPIIVGTHHGSLKREELAACGVRIMLQGHLPVRAAVKGLHETYAHLFNGGAPEDLESKVASDQEMATLVNDEGYKKWQDEYLR